MEKLIQKFWIVLLITCSVFNLIGFLEDNSEYLRLWASGCLAGQASIIVTYLLVDSRSN